MKKHSSRREFLKFAAAAGAAAVGSPILASKKSGLTSSAYNIVMITTDQERRRMHFPSSVVLPNHDRLMARGTSFTQYHTTTAPCTPARATLYTGQHAPSVRMPENIDFGYVADLDPSYGTLGHMLRAQGYYTAYKGKWHLSEMPKICTQDFLEPYGFSEFNDNGDPHGGPLQGHRDDPGIADNAIAWLRDRAPVVNQSKPFFLAVNFVNPHDIMFYDTDGLLGRTQVPQGAIPMLPAPPDYSQTFNPALPASFYLEDPSTKPAAHGEYDRIMKFVFGDIPLNREDLWKKYMDFYINALLDVDSHIGAVLDTLDATGLSRNTIVIFCADHGEMGGAHQQRQKGPFIYKENLNLPLIICHPDIAGGVESSALAASIDVVPTILSLTGMSASTQNSLFPNIAGVDLSGVLGNSSNPGPRSDAGILFTYDGVTTVDADYSIAMAKRERLRPLDPCPAPLLRQPDLKKRGFLRGIYDGRYKFARYFSPVNFNRPSTLQELIDNNELELYDTFNDPDELNNLARNYSENSGLIDELYNKLELLIDIEIGDDTEYGMPDFNKCQPPAPAMF
jgi:arylsulfatase